MATVQLSQSAHQIRAPSLRRLSPHPGSSLLAPHAYHTVPTAARDGGLLRVRPPRGSVALLGPTHPRGAVLRDISGGTSYQTVRLVFRHYAHLTASSCTSERLRTSSALSSTFIPHRHSSLSFGSHPRAHSPSQHDAHMVSLVRVSRRAEPRSLKPPALSFCIRLLFTLRSLYLSAIGHRAVFSLRWPSPPHSDCTTKQPYSPHTQSYSLRVDPPLCTALTARSVSPASATQLAPSRTDTRDYHRAASLSLADTREIPVGFFSSLY